MGMVPIMILTFQLHSIRVFITSRAVFFKVMFVQRLVIYCNKFFWYLYAILERNFKTDTYLNYAFSFLNC